MAAFASAMSQTKRSVTLWQALLIAICFLLALNLFYYHGQEVVTKANLSYSLAMRSDTELCKDIARSMDISNIDPNQPPKDNLEQSPRLKIFDMAAFKVANVGKDSVDTRACKLTKHLRVTQ